MMGYDREGGEILGSWGIAELHPIEPADYEPMRDMMRVAAL